MKSIVLSLVLVPSVSAQIYQRWIFDQDHSITNRQVAAGEVVALIDRTESGNWKGESWGVPGFAPVLTANYPDSSVPSVLQLGSVIVGPASIRAISKYPTSYYNYQVPTTVIVLQTFVSPGVGAQIASSGSPAIAILESSNDLQTWTTQASVTVTNPPSSLYFRARIR